MKSLRGRVALYDLITLILLCGVIWIVILISTLLSIFVHLAIGIVLFVMYLIGVGCWIICTWQWSWGYMWKSSFVLALFLWAENNWYYLKHNCLLRPGYNAKWIEFIFETKRIKKEIIWEAEEVESEVSE